jgi:succinyl-CoA synthetase beta subunit
MNIHEYQAKSLLKGFSIPVLPGGIAHSATEAVDVAKKIGGSLWVVKAQIHAGGRGKAGGVKLAKSLDDVGTIAGDIIGKCLVTPQTSADGKEVHKVYIESGCDIQKELYLSLLVDRQTKRIAIVASTEGGMDIEEVAEKTPEKVHTIFVSPVTGFCSYHGRYLAKKLQLEGETARDMERFIKNAYEAFIKLDASLIEINPLVVTREGDLKALDAKMSFDDNALYRQPSIQDLRDISEEDPHEVEAKKHDLNYIKLDGTIGCMVNGAGLAMATMDIIKLHGGEPANFLDVGGGATAEKVTEAFKLILSDAAVKGILVNIFGGIMKCDVIAEGIIQAARDVHLHVPLVVRLQGTRVEEGKKLLSASGLSIIAADSLSDAAEKIVQAIR